MKVLLLILFFVATFLAGVIASSKIAAVSHIDLTSMGKSIDFWANRYQTFLGVLVAIAVAYFTLSVTSKQISISERQFLSGQVQGLLADQRTLQFVISQLREARNQKVLFENNIAFLETVGDQINGWQNGANLIRTAYSNIEMHRELVSSNTARFLGSTERRTALIAKLDSIVSSQEELRNAFFAWANLNRAANADLDAPATSQKIAYFRTKDQVVNRFEELLPLASAVADDLASQVQAAEADIIEIHKAIKLKSKN